ncbi:unnamed protein product [Adineta steineri]|uniref:Thioredoxin domain-containing protein n=1 Tax=Adineta steineri TaxID=433720 RepID=A0A814S3R9_9BILA|nr:unnamed protein product [Adineta steineri]
MFFTRIYLFCVLILFIPNLILTQPLDLTDKTWKDMLCGQWMVEFYAPWCPSCQHFKHIWSDFAKAMVTKEVKVAAVDINEYPSLSGRFRIAVLPTIYYVRDGVFYQFNGERSLNGLKNYIELHEWQRTEPVSRWFAPDSFPMSMVSSLFDISVLVKDAYTVLLNDYGWPAWLIYIIFALAVILIGFIIGFGFLMIIDYCLTGEPKDDIDNIPDDSRDIEDLDETDTQKLLIPRKKPNPTLVASSTPQRTTAVTKTRASPLVEIQDDEALLDEVLADDQDDDDDDDEDDDSDRLNTSDVAQATDEEDQTSHGSIRQRRNK